MKCEFCEKTINAQDICPDCGTTKYTAAGSIIYGATAKDGYGCEVTITDKYLIIRRVTGGEKTGDILARSSGLLGVFINEVVKDVKDRDYGYYPLSQIQKGIFPYLTKGIKRKNAIKIINKDGSDFILIFDKPGMVDSAGKVLKKMIEHIRVSIPVVEDGTNLNFGTVCCEKPFVTLDNFDKIKPSCETTTSSSSTAACETPVEPKVKKAEQPAQPVNTYTQPEEIKVTPPKSEPKKADDTLCENCGSPVSDTSKFCAQCGKKIERVKRCSNCGTVLEEGDKFCNECGTKVAPAKPRINKCLRCGEILSDNDKFCSNCGYQAK